ncbi:DUF3726 domain-containing protein [uncultured Hoeflea sp.]|uniref:DUF3726 domain-containing protein n=1 Tax=uncultured Hoeflea sp. TaxID=538666 RepID=UPI00261FFEE2|nr:DUF3726 domain-containing protein [uncultured Hoeflea sp.]
MTEDGSDPIQSGFTPPPTDLALLSSNEAGALCLKAARGAGMSWGLAEEAGYAAAWLYTRGINGPELLLRHLNWIADRAYGNVRPAGHENPVPSDGTALCPVALGASLSDGCTIPQGTIGPVQVPVLLLPFVHQLAVSAASALRLRWNGGHVSVSPEGYVSGDMDDLTALDVTELTLQTDDTSDVVPVSQIAPVPIRRSVLSDLNAYAMQTTVPASSASREDAGSAAGDND